MQKGPLNTPFDCGCKAPPARGRGNDGVYDHHVTPILSKPRDLGPSAPREIFFTDIAGEPKKMGLNLKGGTSISFKK